MKKRNGKSSTSYLASEITSLPILSDVVNLAALEMEIQELKKELKKIRDENWTLRMRDQERVRSYASDYACMQEYVRELEGKLGRAK